MVIIRPTKFYIALFIINAIYARKELTLHTIAAS